MSGVPDTVAAYYGEAAALAARYESVPAAEAHAALADLVPGGPGLGRGPELDRGEPRIRIARRIPLKIRPP